jgi:uncharacterized protein YvpB
MIIHYDNVPFYSQFQDIPRVEWQKKGCGIASLAMAIEFYKPNSVAIMQLLAEAIEAGAYQPGVGWKHKQLSSLVENYGLEGKNYDFSKTGNLAAFDRFKYFLSEGPVIVSIHNKFNPKATLGHIVVVTGMDNGFIHYHDPAGMKVEKKISTAGFLKGWKRRFIVVREKPQLQSIQINMPAGRKA